MCSSDLCAKDGRNVMPPSIACAKSGVTTGEWAFALREAFGEYRAATGVGRAVRNDSGGLDDLRAEVDRVSRKLGRRLKFRRRLVGTERHQRLLARGATVDVGFDGRRVVGAKFPGREQFQLFA